MFTSRYLFSLALMCSGLAMLSGCAAPTVSGEQAGQSASAIEHLAHTRIPPFSAAKAGSHVPLGWNEWLLHPTKKRTRYTVVPDGAQLVVRADADRSASGLIAPLDVDLATTPILEWQWRIDSTIADADNAVSSTEDAPVRVVLAFEGDKSSLPMRERLFAERVRLLSGRDLPYASLMYIWGTRAPSGSLIANPHTSRIQKLVVDSGSVNVRQWRKHRRNIAADYRRAFGSAPGRLVAVAIMTDTDNTGSVSSAYYGDIRLVPAEPGELESLATGQ
ncbi:MAG TPA: DUF3047 domain-containing protein [Burkholderiaceae bacterium]|jgi:hypothetical protein|nr:DUF3047 domain-containing protein [Burkholderiaceae bacterium]